MSLSEFVIKKTFFRGGILGQSNVEVDLLVFLNGVSVYAETYYFMKQHTVVNSIEELKSLEGKKCRGEFFNPVPQL